MNTTGPPVGRAGSRGWARTAEAAQRRLRGRRRAGSSLATRAARQSQARWEPLDETGLPQIEHEVMHVVDRRLLLAHLEGEDVADRDAPGEPSVIHHREVADALRGHHGGTFVDRRVRGAGGDRRRHDLRDLGGCRIAPWRDHATQDVALGGDADQPAALGHHEPPDPALAHELRRFEHGLPRLHGNDVAAFLGEDILDGRHATASVLGGLLDTTARTARAPPYPVLAMHIVERTPQRRYHYGAASYQRRPPRCARPPGRRRARNRRRPDGARRILPGPGLSDLDRVRRNDVRRHSVRDGRLQGRDRGLRLPLVDPLGARRLAADRAQGLLGPDRWGRRRHRCVPDRPHAAVPDQWAAGCEYHPSEVGLVRLERGVYASPEARLEVEVSLACLLPRWFTPFAMTPKLGDRP